MTKNIFGGRIILIYLTFLFGFQQNLLAESDESVNFAHYTIQDGLPSAYIKSIVQDSDGFIWAATRTSVVRFDGKTFREFPAFDEKNAPIKIFCNKLFMTWDSILIGRTINEEYYAFDRDRECFMPYPCSQL